MMSFLEASASELSLVEREMLIQAIKREPALLKFFYAKYKTLEICYRYTLEYDSHQYKAREMCNKAVKNVHGL